MDCWTQTRGPEVEDGETGPETDLDRVSKEREVHGVLGKGTTFDVNLFSSFYIP